MIDLLLVQWSPLFLLEVSLQLRTPSWSSFLSPRSMSSLRNTLPWVVLTWDLGSSLLLKSLSRAAFSNSSTWVFTCEMVSFSSSRPCTRFLCSSESTVKRKQIIQPYGYAFKKTNIFNIDNNNIHNISQYLFWRTKFSIWSYIYIKKHKLYTNSKQNILFSWKKN